MSSLVSVEQIYAQLPIGWQNVACSAEGLRIQARRYGSGYRALAHAMEDRAGWSDDRLREFRDARLRDFVTSAAKNVPYYQRLFARLGMNPGDIRSLEDLQKLPILRKDEVKADTDAFVDATIPEHDLISAHTSGTTGGGLHFRTTRQAEREQWSVWWRYRAWHGLTRDALCGYFGGRSQVPLTQTAPPFWRYNIFGRQIMFSGYHLSERNLPAYVDELRRRRPPWIHGYPSILSLVAAHIVETRTDLGYQPPWVTIGAENLLPRQASVIERGFGTRARQHYGMAEAVANFSGCEHENLHVDEDFAAVEFVPHGTDGAQRIIGTNFSNAAMPFIRYDVGDLATLSDRPCPCGRPGRVVLRVDGRQEDFVVLASGARVGRLDHIFKDLTGIREAQIHQRVAGKIEIRVVRGPSFGSDSESALLREASQRLGADMRVRVEYVDELKRSASGKLRLVVSDLKGGGLMDDAVPQQPARFTASD